MIVDTMSKLEVLEYIAKDYSENVQGRVKSLIPVYRSQTMRMLKPGQKKQKFPPKVFKSPSGLSYTLVFYGFRDIYKTYSYTDFEYKGKHIYANVLDDESVTAYSTHCLKRFAERVLRKDDVKALEVFNYFYSDLKEKTFACVLPSPTHELTGYNVNHGALFFSDYIINDNRKSWFNTCISTREMRESQSRLYKAFVEINDFIDMIGFDPIENPYIKEKVLNFIEKCPEFKAPFIAYLKKIFLFGKLVKSFDWHWYDYTCIDNRLELTKSYLEHYKVNVAGLSPFGEKEGIVFRDEIMYKGKNN